MTVTNEDPLNVLVVGVGGQGIILAAEVLAGVCLEAGLDVKQSEVHGMAQRGGSVVAHVRFGRKIYSPVIERGRADYLLAFEMLEALRWADYLKGNGLALVNRQRINPITVAGGESDYPEDLEQSLADACSQLEIIDGLAIAEQQGLGKAVNVALLGALAEHLGFEESLWREIITRRVPKPTVELNLVVFDAGRRAVEDGGGGGGG
ncbi:indolepyruvate oxidoreductase subunit beta [candidate division KSB1 bacterium]